MVVEAEASKKEAIAAARRDSVKRIQDAEAQCLAAFESSMAKEKERLAQEKDAKLAEGRSAADTIGAASKDRIQEVNDYLKKAFEETINVTS